MFETKPRRRVGAGNAGRADSQRPRRPRIAAPVQAPELGAARRRLASFKAPCQGGYVRNLITRAQEFFIWPHLSPPNQNPCPRRERRAPNLAPKTAPIFLCSNLIVIFWDRFWGKSWWSDAEEISGEILGCRCGRPEPPPIKHRTFEPAAAPARG